MLMRRKESQALTDQIQTSSETSTALTGIAQSHIDFTSQY